jgi:quercetin dioxygenase-like cupin family protein
MDFVRRLDKSQARDTGFAGYTAQFVATQESALIVGSWIAAGGCGPSLHYHENDQLYYLVRGEMNVQLGMQAQRIGAGTFVFIPGGLAHRNWNDGTIEEFHFEAILPCPRPGQEMLHFVQSPDDAPGSSLTGYARSVNDSESVSPPGLEGLRLQRLAMGDRVVVNMMYLDPGGAGPGMHIHDFDQYYYVLEGVMNVEVALQRHTVEAGGLVLLPAGVPHRQWNGSGVAPERHLALLAPGPAPGTIWDWGVDFAPSGEDHYG